MKSSVSLGDVADRTRAELAILIDRQMSPLGLAGMDALAPAQGETILDVGCGAGETLLQLLDRVGPSGRVIGVDVGSRVLEVARARTAHLSQVSVVHGDAANMKFTDGLVDCVFSRFGVMFFDDPIAAFRNLRSLLKPSGKLAFVCWRSLRENELDLFPIESANLASDVDETPFSFGRKEVVADILRSAGLINVDVRPNDILVSSGSAEAMLEVVTRVGALGAMLRRSPELYQTAELKVRAALLTREQDQMVWLRAATWIVTASAQ